LSFPEERKEEDNRCFVCQQAERAVISDETYSQDSISNLVLQYGLFFTG